MQRSSFLGASWLRDRDATHRPGAGSGPIDCWNAGVRPGTPIPWGWKPNGAGSIRSCAATRSRCFINALPLPRRSRTAPMVAAQPASRSGIRPMTRTRTLWTRRTRRRTQRIAPGSSTASSSAGPRSSFARRLQVLSAFGRDHNRFQIVERARQPRRQTVRQKADGRMALTAIPTRNLRAGRGLPPVGAVACHGTSAVRVIGAALKPCIAPRFGPNVFLAGKPRLITKLHTGRGPAGVCPRGPPFCLSKARDYGPASRGAKPPRRRSRPGSFPHSPDIAGNPTTGQCEKRRRASIQLEGETTAPASGSTRPSGTGS